MKKILALLLALCLAFALVACTNNEVLEEEEVLSGNIEDVEADVKDETEDEKEEVKDDKKEEDKKDDKKEEEKKEDKPLENEDKKEDKVETTPEKEPAAEETNLSMGATLKKQFIALTSNGETDIQKIAEKLLQNEVIGFAPAIVGMEPGFLNGFGNEEITGFEKAVLFGPMIGTIPFMGYIFTLPDGADVDAFVSEIRQKANLSWNICTSADELHTAKSGNIVFFLMSPLSMDMDEPMEDELGFMAE